MNLPAHDGLGIRAEQRPVHRPVLVRVFKHGQAESNDPLVRFAHGSAASRLRRLQQILDVFETADKQFVLALEVCIKGGTADIGAVEDLLLPLFGYEQTEHPCSSLPLPSRLSRGFCGRNNAENMAA